MNDSGSESGPILHLGPVILNLLVLNNPEDLFFPDYASPALTLFDTGTRIKPAHVIPISDPDNAAPDDTLLGDDVEPTYQSSKFLSNPSSVLVSSLCAIFVSRILTFP